MRDVDAHILHLVDKQFVIRAQRAFEIVAGRVSQPLNASAMEQGLFLAAGSPEDVITWFGNWHHFLADDAGCLMIHLFQDILNWVVLEAEGAEATKILVNHVHLRATRKVIGSPAFFIAAAYCCTSFLASRALEILAPQELFFNVFNWESHDSNGIIRFLVETGSEEEAVVVGSELPDGVELAVEQLIVLVFGAEETTLVALLCQCKLLFKLD